MRETFTKLASQFDPKKFVRIHHSTWVIIEQIREIHPMVGGQYLVMPGEEREFILSRLVLRKSAGFIDSQPSTKKPALHVF